MQQTKIVAMGYDSVSGTYVPLPITNGGLVVIVTIPTKSLVSLLSISVNTAAFTLYGAYACTNLFINNYTDYALDFRLNGAGNVMTIPALQNYNIGGITNANQVGLRRNDNGALTLTSEAYTV